MTHSVLTRLSRKGLPASNLHEPCQLYPSPQADSAAYDQEASKQLVALRSSTATLGAAVAAGAAGALDARARLQQHAGDVSAQLLQQRAALGTAERAARERVGADVAEARDQLEEGSEKLLGGAAQLLEAVEAAGEEDGREVEGMGAVVREAEGAVAGEGRGGGYTWG